jgi:hypothetical protein
MNLKTEMAKLQHQIFENDYYLEVYHESLEAYKVTDEMIANHSVDEHTIVSICNRMWMDLPDCRAIRREPFFKLCDIAEHVFDDDCIDY